MVATPIAQNSLFAGTALRQGMVLESIDGSMYSTFDEGVALLVESEGRITIMASPYRFKCKVGDKVMRVVGQRGQGQAIKGPFEVISINLMGQIKMKCQSGYLYLVGNEQFQLMHA